MKLCRHLRYDIKCGFARTKKFFAVWFVACVLFCGIFALKSINTTASRISLLDFYLFLFAGEYPYDPSMGVAFQIPYQWLTINAFILYALCSYPIDDLKGLGQAILIKSASRPLWWVSKYIWSQIAATFMYLLLLIAVIAVRGIFGLSGISATAQPVMVNDLAGFSLLTPFLQFFRIFFMPLLVINLLLSFQNIISLLLTPIFSYIISITILFMSAYIHHPVLVGNISMLRRTLPETVSVRGTLIQAVIIAACNLLLLLPGIRKFRNQDVLSNNFLIGESHND